VASDGFGVLARRGPVRRSRTAGGTFDRARCSNSPTVISSRSCRVARVVFATMGGWGDLFAAIEFTTEAAARRHRCAERDEQRLPRATAGSTVRAQAGRTRSDAHAASSSDESAAPNAPALAIKHAVCRWQPR